MKMFKYFILLSCSPNINVIFVVNRFIKDSTQFNEIRRSRHRLPYHSSPCKAALSKLFILIALAEISRHLYIGLRDCMHFVNYSAACHWFQLTNIYCIYIVICILYEYITDTYHTLNQSCFHQK